MAGLLILPGRVLGPDSGTRDVVQLPTTSPRPVEAAPVAQRHIAARKAQSHQLAANRQVAAKQTVVKPVRIISTAKSGPKAVRIANIAPALARPGKPTAKHIKKQIPVEPVVISNTTPPAPTTTTTATPPAPTPTTPTTTTAAAPTTPTAPTPAAPTVTVAGAISITGSDNGNGKTTSHDSWHQQDNGGHDHGDNGQSHGHHR